MADEIEVTPDHMAAAIAGRVERDGRDAVVQLRARVREERTCALDGCAETFVPRNDLHRFCTPAHRAADHRVRTRTGGDAS